MAGCQPDLQSSVRRNISQHPPFHCKYFRRCWASCFLSSFLLTQPLIPGPSKGEDVPHQVCEHLATPVGADNTVHTGHHLPRHEMPPRRTDPWSGQPVEGSRALWLTGRGRSSSKSRTQFYHLGECVAGKKLLLNFWGQRINGGQE